ncbi:big defensin-like [Saccostrea echinata]|uniref:big defensin-like n=1 Tax=Saccostrea echinata TaxID=191078 RepID=UPI002A822939|nr:big defensin-like [Saccostrea echinata]
MERNAFLCILYIMLLAAPGPVLANAQTEREQPRNKRQAQVLLPIASYAGMTVSAPLFLALVAAYGMTQVTRYAIQLARSRTRGQLSSSGDRRSHNCGGWFHDGWCRPQCRSYEYEDWRSSAVCGGWKCCKVR